MSDSLICLKMKDSLGTVNVFSQGAPKFMNLMVCRFEILYIDGQDNDHLYLIQPCFFLTSEICFMVVFINKSVKYF